MAVRRTHGPDLAERLHHRTPCVVLHLVFKPLEEFYEALLLVFDPPFRGGPIVFPERLRVTSALLALSFNLTSHSASMFLKYRDGRPEEAFALLFPAPAFFGLFHGFVGDLMTGVV